jgi:hypothetical protein
MNERGSFGKFAMLGFRPGPLNIRAMNVYARSLGVGNSFQKLEQHFPPPTAMIQHSRRLSARKRFNKTVERFPSYRRIGSKSGS